MIDKLSFKYDYLIVGSGLFGSTFAYLAQQKGKRCLVIDKRPYPGGNIYCEEIEDINTHLYVAHIFHSSGTEGMEPFYPSNNRNQHIHEKYHHLASNKKRHISKPSP